MIIVKRRKRLIESLFIDGVGCRFPMEVLNFACIDVWILCLLLSKVLTDKRVENNISLLSPVKCWKRKQILKNERHGKYNRRKERDREREINKRHSSRRKK